MVQQAIQFEECRPRGNPVWWLWARGNPVLYCGPICMHCICIIVWVILGNSLSFGLQFLILMFLGTSDDRGKAKAWLHTSSYCFMFERLSWHSDFYGWIWKQCLIVWGFYENIFLKWKNWHGLWYFIISRSKMWIITSFDHFYRKNINTNPGKCRFTIT